MTWTEAQSYCREHHTDLASVRNRAENQQLVELFPGGAYWIGLYRDSWKWSDGSNSSFKYWAVNEPNYRASKVCVAAAFDNSGKWEDLDCEVEKPFICYRPVLPVIKVRVEKPNGVDLNDQAFLDAMLVEAKKNLRAQGLDDNVHLAWRKQPDGQVFHEEEEKKRDEL
ncbi:lectin BRA-3-like [Trematomus bernacchii]|uniref:lectin BRA-3-like n=1 Tax=Trematomus bernacchii TaxID=40690 RepID=UPI00146AB13A|nr:lectin BRA-3-like [Trematomus bernacchii]